MPDIDVKVLYLQTPPVSAPQATYVLGVRVKNTGIHARVAFGYARVYDKDTGLLVHTYELTSAEIDPGEEKQAFAGAIWDLSEEAVGKQFIVSGKVTCDGDMVSENDILNPTTVTVTAEAPPPPPPVTPHKHQHEDGGNDELDLTGLHGVLATPQPYGDHAAKHQDDGEDEINVNGLAGQLTEPQIPTEHANERHAVPFATSGQLTEHETADVAHTDASNLEKTANKGAPEGYAPLGPDSKVPNENLPPLEPGIHGSDLHDDTVEATGNKDQASGYPGLDATTKILPVQLGGADPTGVNFLRSDQTWQRPVPVFAPPELNYNNRLPKEGVSDNAARADHKHGGEGGANFLYQAGPLVQPAEHDLIACLIPAGLLANGGIYRLTAAGVIDTDAHPATIQFRVYCGPVGGLVLRGSLGVGADPGMETKSFYLIADLQLNPAATLVSGMLTHDARFDGPEALPWPIGNTAPINLNVDNEVHLTAQLGPSDGNPALTILPAFVQLSYINFWF